MTKYIINSKYQELEDFIKSIPSVFLNSGEIVFSGRNIIKTFNLKGIRLNVKSFKKPIFINQFIYTKFRSSKAKRSYEYALFLKNKGFLTPDPVAYVECKKYTLLKNSFYISIHEDFDGSMRELWHEEFEKSQNLLQQFAQFTANLHENKVLHIDYSSGNILYKKNEDEYQFYLVDLNRMILNKPISLDKACFNFRRLWGSDDMIAFFVKKYAEARGFDENICLKKTFEYRGKFWKFFSKKHPGSTPYIK